MKAFFQSLYLLAAIISIANAALWDLADLARKEREAALAAGAAGSTNGEEPVSFIGRGCWGIGDQFDQPKSGGGNALEPKKESERQPPSANPSTQDSAQPSNHVVQ